MIYACTFFISAFLLFLVQPIVAKQILPWYGGGAGVWGACLVFFQGVLSAGYLYADWLTRRRPSTQALVHSALVIGALACLPIQISERWRPVADAEPLSSILLLLVGSIGLPYLVISSTGPLLQNWFARHTATAGRVVDSAKVYRLFSLSNLASLASLLAYPFVVEPVVDLKVQTTAWSAGFVIFAVLMGITLWLSFRKQSPVVAGEPFLPAGAPPRAADYLVWLSLSGLGTVLLLAVTSHLTQNIASVPFLWIVPLSLYLLTFILCFDTGRWYRRSVFLPLLLAAGSTMAWAMQVNGGGLPITKALPIFGGGLFIACMFCHGELAALRPHAAYLTRFYLMVSLGGALGSILIGVVAPVVLDANWELPATILLLSIAAFAAVRRAVSLRLVAVCAGGFALFCVLLRQLLILAPVQGESTATETVFRLIAFQTALLVVVFMGWRRRDWRVSAGLGALLALVVSTTYLSNSADRILSADNIHRDRNFYGAIRVEKRADTDGSLAHRLMHGIILHGAQYQEDSKRRVPTSYYSADSGVGAVLGRSAHGARVIGVAGLGVGTLLAYGRPDDDFKLYEIDPQIVWAAEHHFTFLADSPSKREVFIGDARLSLAGQAPHAFDVLVVDAFSGDSIPTHLLTREAMQIYEKHLASDGALVFHVSNRYLSLAPVVQRLAEERGFMAVDLRDKRKVQSWTAQSSEYVVVSRNKALMDDLGRHPAAVPFQRIDDLQTWTDSHHNLWAILKD